MDNRKNKASYSAWENAQRKKDRQEAMKDATRDIMASVSLIVVFVVLILLSFVF